MGSPLPLWLENDVCTWSSWNRWYSVLIATFSLLASHSTRNILLFHSKIAITLCLQHFHAAFLNHFAQPLLENMMHMACTNWNLKRDQEPAFLPVMWSQPDESGGNPSVQHCAPQKRCVEPSHWMMTWTVFWDQSHVKLNLWMAQGRSSYTSPDKPTNSKLKTVQKVRNFIKNNICILGKDFWIFGCDGNWCINCGNNYKENFGPNILMQGESTSNLTYKKG